MSKDVIICLAKTDTNGEWVIKDSVIRWCIVCGDEVWVSPHTLEHVESGRFTPMCEDCGFGAMGADGDPEFAATPNATAREKRMVRELNQALKKRRGQ